MLSFWKKFDELLSQAGQYTGGELKAAYEGLKRHIGRHLRYLL